MRKPIIYQKVILLFALLFAFSFSSYSQKSSDSTISNSLVIKKHSPKKATLYSAILPGLGQAYNKKYWKIPLLYAGFGVLIYYKGFNKDRYNKYKTAYNYRTDNDPATIDEFADRSSIYTVEVLKRQKNYWKRNHDLVTIGIVALYLANIIDASVDAHFFNYDINDDLSLKIEPALIQETAFNNTIGISCKIRF